LREAAPLGLNRPVTGDEGSLREQPVLAVDEDGDAIVVRLRGDLDLYNVEQVRAALAGAVDRTPARLVVDLDQVDFVDSTALGALVEARRGLGAGAFRVAAPRPEVRRALEVSGLDRHLDVRTSVDAALAPD
jgi:anti-sigma B factor antagonist